MKFCCIVTLRNKKWIEESKIHCAREHFKAINNRFAARNGDVVYDVIDSYQSLLNLIFS